MKDATIERVLRENNREERRETYGRRGKVGKWRPRPSY